MIIRRKRTIRYGLVLLGLLALTGCGSPSSDSVPVLEGQEQSAIPKGNETESGDLIYEGSMELKYAQNFSVDFYEGGCRMLQTMDGTKILVVPENQKVPDKPGEDVVILQQPVQNLYLVSSAVMDMFCSLDALDAIRFSGQKAENWYVDEAREAMERGEILYAGKYSKPDYETIVSGDCPLAIENRMITHAPEVVEMLGDFGIPVLIEYSSYESHPLGRVEWIKFFGAMLGKEEEAERLFEQQEAILKEVTSDEETGQTVAFFFITSNGLVQIRQSSDYIPKLIELAGGKYIFENMGEESGRSTMNIQIEEFYQGARDADFLIYNSTIDGGVDSIEELLRKCPVLSDFKAVQEGKVFCTTRDYYQQSMSIGELLQDLHTMLLGKDEQMNYLFRLE